jgi:hypothetical protein
VPEINVRPRKLRTVRRGLALVGFGALAAAIITMPAAKADPLNNTQTAYVLAYHGAVCKTISAYPSEAGVAGVLSGVMQDGFGPVESAQIVNASVAAFCPRWWSLLQSIGDRARAADSGAYVA